MSHHDGADLLVTLRRLYSKVLTLHLKAPSASSSDLESAGMPQHFVLSLSDYIENLAANADLDKEHTPDLQINNVEGNGSRSPTSFDREYSPEMGLGELSTHLRKSHIHSGVSLNTGDKLMQSTWEHFHASIRCARQGDLKTARMHAALTNNALSEAAHYLPESVYASFSKEVMEALEEINSNKK